MKDTWHKVGKIGVDAGLCWVGDPCYILHKSKAERPKEIGKNWIDFCKLVSEPVDGGIRRATQFGHALGVCVSTCDGDGVYPVMARFGPGGIAEIRVVFDGAADEEP